MTNSKKRTNKTAAATSVNRVSTGSVYFDSNKNRYIARFSYNGNRVHVGSFNTERTAKTALRNARYQYGA
jgi:hypothetical protein